MEVCFIIILVFLIGFVTGLLIGLIAMGVSKIGDVKREVSNHE